MAYPVNVSVAAVPDVDSARTIKVTFNNNSSLDVISGSVAVYSLQSKESEIAGVPAIPAGGNTTVSIGFGNVPPDSYTAVLNDSGAHWSWPNTTIGEFTEISLTATD